MISRRRSRGYGLAIGFLAIFVGFWLYGRNVDLYYKMIGRRTVKTVLDEIGDSSRKRLAPHFATSGVAYPPERVALLAFKDTARLEVYGRRGSTWAPLLRYPILAQSGGPGPKLREGDRQVPEGIYSIEGLNPNSAYHLSMKLNYPNDFDRAKAKEDNRNNPGSDIFIHGRAVSVGCLAMGDDAIEELFTLVADVGIDNVSVIISPTDFRDGNELSAPVSPGWTTDLYSDLRAELAVFPR